MVSRNYILEHEFRLLHFLLRQFFWISSGPDYGKNHTNFSANFYKNDRMYIYVVKLVQFTWISVYNSQLYRCIIVTVYISECTCFWKTNHLVRVNSLIGYIYISKFIYLKWWALWSHVAVIFVYFPWLGMFGTENILNVRSYKSTFSNGWSLRPCQEILLYAEISYFLISLIIWQIQ